MTLPTDRHRKIVEKALNALGRETTLVGDILASVGALRRVAKSIGARSLADLLRQTSGQDREPAARSHAWEEAYRLRKENHTLKNDLSRVTSKQKWLEGQIEQLTKEMETLWRGGFGLANSARTARANQHARQVRVTIDQIRRENAGISNEGIAQELTRRRIKTPRWGKIWTRVQVHRVLARTT
jgi:hypothetical protein